MTATNGVAVLDKVRAALDEFRAAGETPPGRRPLAKLVGESEHQVRLALKTLDDEAAPASTHPHPPGTQSPAGEQPGDPASTHRPPRPWPLILIGVAAAVAVWGGWVDLGRMTGFGMVQPLPGVWDELWVNTAIVLPIGIEAYGGYALRVWLSSAALSDRTRMFARRSAWASLGVGAGAQVTSHLMRAAEVGVAPWWVTVLVACVPVGVLGLATGLATLVRQDTTRSPAGEP